MYISINVFACLLQALEAQEQASMQVDGEGGEASGAGEGAVVHTLEVALVKAISKGFEDVIQKIEATFDLKDKANTL